MIYTTKGIVLRTVKYGETSVIVSILTSSFGMQSYIVNGVRTQSKTSKAHFFQPSSMLDMEVYHNELKNLQRIKELKWSYLYRHILSDVTKNSVALYMVELLHKCLKQPEVNTDLFHFCEDAFIRLDVAERDITANFPLYFGIQLAHFLGLSIQDNYSSEKKYFNIKEGNFTAHPSPNDSFLESDLSHHFSQLLKALQPEELKEIRINKHIRKSLLYALEHYYLYHVPEFGAMKTLPVLHEVLG